MIYTVENTADIGKPMKVFLDGVEVKDCSYADTEKGEILEHRAPLWQQPIKRTGIVTVEPVYAEDPANQHTKITAG